MTEVNDPEHALNINQNLLQVLRHLLHNPFPTVETPPALKKRASVALIIRVQPRYAHWPTEDWQAQVEGGDRLKSFFAQEWVKYGDPEILFIRRAARKGDLWTSHVALPGGRRDPDDKDDQAAAVREAYEEVGVDLTSSNAMVVGNLPQRIVTTAWGKVQIMVLCPYVFLLTSPNIPPLHLQPTEVASAHWVPIKSLLSPAMRTYEHHDISHYLAGRKPGALSNVRRWQIRLSIGRMLFAAIRLTPAESLNALDTPGSITEEESKHQSLLQMTKSWMFGDHLPNIPADSPLILWGLTLGVIADLLEMLPPHNSLVLWSYPTFSPPDLRSMLWLMSYFFRKRNRPIVCSPAEPADESLNSLPSNEWFEAMAQRNQGLPEASPSGLGAYPHRYGVIQRGSRSSAVEIMLADYWAIVRRAVQVTLIGRSTLIFFVAIYIWKRYIRIAR